MTVAEVLKAKEYIDNLQKLLDLLWESRQKARLKAHTRNQELKKHAIDDLHAMGYWATEQFVAEYCSVIDKQSRLSAVQRDYIREVGTSAYVTTLKQYQNETKGTKRVRKNQPGRKTATTDERTAVSEGMGEQ